MEADEKVCPRCAETIKKAALVCRFCGNEFAKQAPGWGAPLDFPDEPAPVSKRAAKAKSNKVGVGCLVIIGIFFVLALIGSMGGSDQKTSGSTDEKVEAAKTAEEHRQGMHCLSPWDGAYKPLVAAVKTNLRDPKSFEHAETRITPVDAEGHHTVLMQYRARNGFGGMNLGYAKATVANADCNMISFEAPN